MKSTDTMEGVEAMEAAADLGEVMEVGMEVDMEVAMAVATEEPSQNIYMEALPTT